VRRAGAKASKRAAFTVKASDDDMDFMVRQPSFSCSFDGARGGAQGDGMIMRPSPRRSRRRAGCV
jgi:hypothetical protein